MAITAENVAVTTTTTGAQNIDLGKDPVHTTTIIEISGTYTGLTLTWQTTLDGTNWANVYTIDMSAGTPITGGTAPTISDSSNVLYKFDSGGVIAIRANISALATATSLKFTPFNFSAVGSPVLYSNAATSTFAGNQTFNGGITMADAQNIAVGTTTGTKIGTATTQKLGFYNATPIVQPANTVDYVTMLTNLGLRATGGTAAATFPGALSCTALTATSVAGTGTVALTDNMTITDAKNIVLNATTGTIIGTATTQKLGFYNATPIVQPVGTTDLRTALINLGFVATGGASPLNLNGGAFTAGSIAGTGTVALTDNMTITDAKNIVLNATTGTIIGTATTQKLSFYNATPVVQPAANTDTTTGAAGSTTTCFLNTTFTGNGGTAAFTIGGVVTKLKALGLLAP